MQRGLLYLAINSRRDWTHLNFWIGVSVSWPMQRVPTVPEQNWFRENETVVVRRTFSQVGTLTYFKYGGIWERRACLLHLEHPWFRLRQDQASIQSIRQDGLKHYAYKDRRSKCWKYRYSINKYRGLPVWFRWRELPNSVAKEPRSALASPANLRLRTNRGERHRRLPILPRLFWRWRGQMESDRFDPLDGPSGVQGSSEREDFSNSGILLKKYDSKVALHEPVHILAFKASLAQDAAHDCFQDVRQKEMTGIS